MQVSQHYLLEIVNRCELVGVPREQVLAVVPGGEEALADVGRVFDSDCLLDVLRTSSEFLNDPSIGLLIGSKFNVSVLNQTGVLLPLCETFGEAASMMSRYHKLTQTMAVTHLSTQKDQWFLNWDILAQDAPRYYQFTETFFTGTTMGAKWLLWNVDERPIKLTFRHPCPTEPTRYEEIIGCPVLFNQPQDALVMPIELMTSQLPTSNPSALRELTRKLDRMMIQLDDDQSLRERVRASIREQLWEGAPSLETTATDVNLSVPNLRYKLRNGSSSFRSEVSDVRRELCDIEMNKGRPMFQIAQRLGFHDQSAFNRAFQKWYGESPTQFMQHRM